MIGSVGSDTPKILFLSWRVFLSLCEPEGFEIIGELAGIGIVTGTHKLCSSDLLRTTIRRDLSKSSAVQIDLDAS